MASVQDVADGCPEMLAPLLRFLATPSPRSPAVDEAHAFLLVVLPMSYVACIVVAHFAGLVLAYLHLASATAMSFADVVRFIALLFALVFAWLLIIDRLVGLPLRLPHRRRARDSAGVQLERARLNP